jgi:hypothetical protein
VRRREPAGQAAAEYTALLLVVAVLLAVAAVAVPGIGERVVEAVRAGLCIVGGDVCRSSDAVAAGLEPCVTRARSRREDTALEIAVVRVGEQGEWQLALRSDGAAVVTRIAENQIGGTAGVGVSFSPAGVDAGAGATLVARFNGGRAWRFPDARSAAAFLDRAMGGAPPPDTPDAVWHAVGSRADAGAGAMIADLAEAGVDVGGGSAIGVRSEGARRTLTVALDLDDPGFAAELPGFSAWSGRRRSWVADISWEGGAARELALRAATGDDERLEEFVARLDLREPGNRAVAARVLRPRASTLADLRALSARIKTHGVIEHTAYALTERSRGFSVGAKLGVALGLEHHSVSSERRLVDAVAWIRGGPLQRRFDCLGV